MDSMARHAGRPGRKSPKPIRVPFAVEQWRKGNDLPEVQGIVVGSDIRHETSIALVDQDDIHCLMIGTSGVGKTAFFLYPNLEYTCASGMSFLALDSKGDLARNYGAVASKYYGYHVAVIDLRNPTRSDGYNPLTLINRYTARNTVSTRRHQTSSRSSRQF